MGISISKTEFTDVDFQQFGEKVRRDLVVLKSVLAQEHFGRGLASLGAEVEFYIVDQQGLVKPINLAIGERVNDPLLTMELNRFNLEYNLSPQPFRGEPFKAFEQELQSAVSHCNQAAKALGGQLVPIGILPTLRPQDFNLSMMTDLPRYHVLSKALRDMRGEPFKIHIAGQERVNISTNYVTLEGANTSYQLHWRVPTEEFSAYYNAVQLVTPIALALAANSPGLLQNNLWDETRVALFKQSIDTRSPSEKAWRHPPRVYFGNGWVNQPWDCFAASAVLYPPIIPLSGNENPEAVFAEGKTPALEELTLHHGTTWPWNRAVYDYHDGGHLRIELRSLPAGPTAIDMNANGLLMIGLAKAMLDKIDRIKSIMPFHYAEHNFYRAAKFGLEADLIWPDDENYALKETKVMTIANELLPIAKNSLLATDMDDVEINRLFNVIEGRLENKVSGARWQRHRVNHYLTNNSKFESYQLMLQDYINNSSSKKPVHEWQLAP